MAADAVAAWSVEDVASWMSRQPIDGAEAIAQRFREEEIHGKALLQYGLGSRKELKEDFGLTMGKATTVWEAIRSADSGSGGAEPSPLAGSNCTRSGKRYGP